MLGSGDGAHRDAADFPTLDRIWRLPAGRTLRTEISRKFDFDLLTAEVESHAFAVAVRWTDAAGDYRLSLYRAE